MKLSIVIISILIITNVSEAEEKTLIKGEITHGGFGALGFKSAQVFGKFAILAGGQADWIMNHTYGLGLGAYMVATDKDKILVSGYENALGVRPYPHLAYGGLILSYTGMSDKAFHPVFDLLVGGGNIILKWEDGIERVDNRQHDNAWKYDNFFILEPTANLEMNLLTFVRMNVGLGYRFVNGVEKYGYHDSDVSGISGSLTLKFGKF